MSNQEENKCEHDAAVAWFDPTHIKALHRRKSKKIYPACPFCKPFEVKQEIECYCEPKSIYADCPRHGKPMTNIKTPEEIAWKILFCETCNGQGYTVQGETDRPEQVQCDVCYQGCKAEYKEIARLISEAISAERNANAEKIRELVELSNSHAKSYAEAQERYLIARQELDHIKGSCGLCHPEEHHQKIKKLEKQMEIYRLETHRWSKAYKELKEEIND